MWTWLLMAIGMGVAMGSGTGVGLGAGPTLFVRASSVQDVVPQERFTVLIEEEVVSQGPSMVMLDKGLVSQGPSTNMLQERVAVYLPYANQMRVRAPIACGASATWEHFDTEDGLGLPVYDVAVDTHGGTWFASNLVTRLEPDGSITRFDAGENGVPLGMNFIHGAISGADGTTWLVPQANQFFTFRRPDTWRVLDIRRSSHALGDVLDMDIDADGVLWVAAARSWDRVMSFPGGALRVELDGDPDRLDGPVWDVDVLAVSADHSGGVWFGLADGVARRSADGTWTVWSPTDEAEYLGVVRAIAFGPDGTGWFGTSFHGFFTRTPEGRWIQPPSGASLRGTPIYDIELDDRGQAWVATSKGVACIAPSGDLTWWSAEMDSGPAYNTVRRVTVGDEGSVWFAMESRGVSVVGR